MFDGVGIAHQQYRRSGIAPAKFADDVEHVAQANTALQGALMAALDDRPLGHGVGKGHAQFDDIGAGANQRQHEIDGDIRGGIAGDHIGHEGLARRGPERREHAGDTAHGA